MSRRRKTTKFGATQITSAKIFSHLQSSWSNLSQNYTRLKFRKLDRKRAKSIFIYWADKLEISLHIYVLSRWIKIILLLNYLYNAKIKSSRRMNSRSSDALGYEHHEIEWLSRVKLSLYKDLTEELYRCFLDESIS